MRPTGNSFRVVLCVRAFVHAFVRARRPVAYWNWIVPVSLLVSASFHCPLFGLASLRFSPVRVMYKVYRVYKIVKVYKVYKMFKVYKVYKVLPPPHPTPETSYPT